METSSTRSGADVQIKNSNLCMNDVQQAEMEVTIQVCAESQPGNLTWHAPHERVVRRVGMTFLGKIVTMYEIMQEDGSMTQTEVTAMTEEPEVFINIDIKTLSGSKIVLQVSTQDTLLDVKQSLFEMPDTINYTHFALRCNGVEMNDYTEVNHSWFSWYIQFFFFPKF